MIMQILIGLQGKISFLYKAMEEDFKSTGKCNLELGKDDLMNLLLNLALQKKSPLIPILNEGQIIILLVAVWKQIFKLTIILIRQHYADARSWISELLVQTRVGRRPQLHPSKKERSRGGEFIAFVSQRINRSIYCHHFGIRDGISPAIRRVVGFGHCPFQLRQYALIREILIIMSNELVY